MIIRSLSHHEVAVDMDTEQIVDILKESGVKKVKVPKDAAEAGAYWKMRSAGLATVFGPSTPF